MNRKAKTLMVAGVTVVLSAIGGLAYARTDAGPAGAEGLKWQACPSRDMPLVCTTVRVPVDWERPTGATLSLKVAKLPSTGERKGTIFTNPGGPGGSGVQALPGLAGKFGTAVRESYDIVSWDPRGIGESSPLKCPPAADAAYAKLGLPRSLDERVRFERGVRTWADACRRTSGPLFDHVDTRSNARDLDRLRELLGGPKLNYAGFSYGSRIGLFYADLFPKRVGRMLVDAVVDPTSDNAAFTDGQATAAEQAFTDYHATCGDRPSCPVQDMTTAQARAWLAPFLKRDPGLNGLLPNILRSPKSWPGLDELLGELRSGTYQPEEPEADDIGYHAVNCLDLPDRRSARQITAAAERAEARYPLFGRMMTGGAVCSQWPVPATNRPHPITARGSQPILVVGATHDTATPYRWAVAAAKHLSASRLLTVRDTMHVAYGVNSCATAAIDRYFLSGELPKPDRVCAAG